MGGPEFRCFHCGAQDWPAPPSGIVWARKEPRTCNVCGKRSYPNQLYGVIIFDPSPELQAKAQELFDATPPRKAVIPFEDWTDMSKSAFLAAAQRALAGEQHD